MSTLPFPSARAGLLSGLLALAQRAAAAIEQVRACGAIAVEHKDDHSPLTAADLAAQAVLGPGLKALAPQWPVVSEEAVPADCSTAPRYAAGYFAVDPLDGTKEFIACTGEYAVNIGLIEQGRATLGVIACPPSGLAWVGEVGVGCWRVQADGALSEVRVQPCPAVPRVALSRFHPSPALTTVLERLGPHAPVTIGAAMKFIALIEGRLDLYPRLKSGMSQWDIVAGHAILEAAGGRMTRLDGAELNYDAGHLLAPGFLAYADRSVDWVGRLGVA